MSFTPNVPSSGQSLGNSRSQILNNFAILRSTIAVDHVDVNDSGNGKHKFCHLKTQGAAPTTDANEGAIYTKTSGSNAVLFYRVTSNGQEIQLTGNTNNAIANNGSTCLPNGS